MSLHQWEHVVRLDIHYELSKRDGKSKQEYEV